MRVFSLFSQRAQGRADRSPGRGRSAAAAGRRTRRGRQPCAARLGRTQYGNDSAPVAFNPGPSTSPSYRCASTDSHPHNVTLLDNTHDLTNDASLVGGWCHLIQSSPSVPANTYLRPSQNPRYTSGDTAMRVSGEFVAPYNPFPVSLANNYWESRNVQTFLTLWD